jgi:hypothetical protein
MSQQEPAVYNLEFSEDVAFWAEAGEGARRAFLMPLPDPGRFVAFGVVGPGDTVHFVARGRVHTHLGAFIDSMERDGARVELYTRVPLPWNLVKRYTSDDPYENQETEGPREPPVRGLVAYGGGAQVSTGVVQTLAFEPSLASEPLASASFGWPTELAPTRRVIIIPATGGDDFIAFGVCSAPDRFVFVARGCMSTQLGGFLDRMKLAGATVEHCDWPPLTFLQAYANKYAGALFSPHGLVAHAGPQAVAQAS